MKVSIISATEKPVDVISLAAGICYKKQDVREKRLAHCYENGHMSVFEHACVTFRIEGISRACMAQLTRHRMASFCVESQRYNKYDLSGNDWYVMPESFNGDEDDEYGKSETGFKVAASFAAIAYKNALELGIKAEDARYLLPEATKTNLIMTCNLRELFHFFDMRLPKAAQWEIRGLANEMLCEVGAINDQWAYLMELYGSRK